MEGGDRGQFLGAAGFLHGAGDGSDLSRSGQSGVVVVGRVEAETGAQGRRVGVRRILDPGNAGLTKRGAEPGGIDAEQRTKKAETGLLEQGGHAGKTTGGAAGENADHEGLGLIGRVMAEQEVEDAGFAAGCGKGVIASLAGAFREGGSGSQAAEREDAAGHVPGGEAFGDGCSLGGGIPGGCDGRR